jgi:hypothetical protein
VGFALWVDREIAWAAGTVEYRALGAAVISRTDLFRARDFQRDVRPPGFADPSFAGYFASLGQVNEYLSKSRRKVRVKLRGG